MIVKAEPTIKYSVGQKVTFAIETDKAHFFEKEEKVYPNGKTENVTII